MINVSNEFKTTVKGDGRQFYSGAEITLANGTVLNLDNSKIRQLKIDDSVSNGSQFQLGAAIINKHTLVFNNFDDAYSDYDFTGAIIRPRVGLQLSSSIETLNKGVFTADDPKVKSSIITLTALDNMMKFDKPFKGVTQVFPCTYGDLLYTACIHCGVVLSTTTFMNSDKVIQSRPDDDATNCREIVSWIAQSSGNFARCNTSGQLELKWYDFKVFEDEQHYDGGSFDEDTPYSTGDNLDGGTFAFTDGDNADGGDFLTQNRYHHIYAMRSNPTISTDDVVITGLRVIDFTEEANTAFYGQEGYVITIEKNPLIQSLTDAQMIANTVGAKIVGMRFRPMSLTTRSDPTIEAGNVGYVSTRKGVYQTVFTNVIFSVGQSMTISCNAESPARNSAVRYSEDAKAVVEARKNTEKQLTAYDLMVQQLNNLVAHSFGVYKTDVPQPDGSIIYYMHDKPTLAESMKIWKQTADAFAVSTNGGVTYTAGFDVNGNAVFNVLSAIGINADWIRLGKLLSNDGSTLIDMAYGVANSDNFSFIDNIQSGFPLTMPFNIDSSVSKINKVLLKFTQQNFRTYSTTASSGGGGTQTSAGGGGGDSTTDPASSHKTTSTVTQLISLYNTSLSTSLVSSVNGLPHAHTIDSHSHDVLTMGHSHSIDFAHDHGVDFPEHTHSVYFPDHSHSLNFGIKEQAISNNEITIFVDGVLRATTSDLQGIIDLTAFVTTPGWHTIEVRSTTLKRVSAQINIKSYIKS